MKVGRDDVVGRAPGWSDLVPRDVEGLDAAQRGCLAMLWRREAQRHGAAVASTGRRSLVLLTLGAPAALVDDGYASAREALRHAGACFGLTSRYTGRPVGPTALQAVPLPVGLGEVACGTALDCVADTVAALRAAARLERADDPAVRRVVEAIARDQAVHAERAWRAIAWTVREGGDRIRRLVATTLQRSIDAACESEASLPTDPSLERHGYLDASRLAAARRAALDHVIAMCAARLLRTQPEPACDAAQ